MWKFVIIYFKHDISRKSAVQLLLFFVCEKKKNYNAVVSRQNIRIRLLLFLLFDVNFFCFVLFLRDKFWCFYHFLWAFWLKRKCTFHRNIYINEKLNPFSSKICHFYVKKKKNNILTDYKRSYFSNFSLILSANMYCVHLFTGKLNNNFIYIIQ